MMGFAAEAADYRGQGVSGRVLCLLGELQCDNERLLNEIHALGPDGVFERGKILESLGDAPGAGVAELRGLGFRRQGPGELADQWVQADPLLVQLLDQPDIVQTLEGAVERRGIARPAGRGHSREQAERGDRDGHRLGKLAGHPEDKPRRFIAWPEYLPLGLQGRRHGGLVDRLEVDRGQVGDLGIERRQAALLLEPRVVVGEGDLRPLGEEGAGELQGEREIAEQPADRPGPGPLRVVRVVPDGMPRVIPEEQLEGGPLREHRNLDGLESAQLALAGGEEDAAAQRERACLRADRTGELGGVLEVVEDQQGVGPALQLVEGGAELLVRRTFENLGTQPAADLSQALGQWLGRVDPEDAVRVGVVEAVDVLDRELGLADAAHAGQPRRPDADGLALLQGGVQPLQVVGAADEVVIPGERHKERSLARRGVPIVPSPRRAYRKFPRASSTAPSPGPFELSAQRINSPACSGTETRLSCRAAPGIMAIRVAKSAGVRSVRVRTRVSRSMAGILCGLGAGKTVGWLAGQDDDFGWKTASWPMAFRMPRATSANASSQIFQLVTGFPSVGRD